MCVDMVQWTMLQLLLRDLDQVEPLIEIHSIDIAVYDDDVVVFAAADDDDDGGDNWSCCYFLNSTT